MELPKECIADILGRTTPLDVARNSIVSKIFCSAADSDSIWNNFLPSDFHSIISQSPFLANAPKKTIYLALSDHPIIIDQGKKSFQLDRKTGKKCYMLAARALQISMGDDERYCGWVTLPESRFEEVAKLEVAKHEVGFWYDIYGMINTVDLSPNTQYAAFLVFKMITDNGGPIRALLSIDIFGVPIRKNAVCLDMKLKLISECPNVRSDGLLEIEMGEFFNSGLEDGEVEMRAMISKFLFWEGSFYLEGIEVRPKL
ncbi:putative F-box protein PP2-B12 [Lotus japonicus]|uniref:putative F-box protein PP2-B12 n=1 Tax=Lotus japonicus TaxID=34305 RepID=UPI00258CCFAB|nr:putative F-box protein PP2-B12 [Lotus japonicus]